MRTVSILTGFALLTLAGHTPSQPAEKLKSGPQVGATLPGPFAPINVNGDGKDRPRCLVTLYGSDPVIMVIAREPADGKDTAVMELMKKLDGFIAKHRERDLRGFMVFLSGDARSKRSGQARGGGPGARGPYPPPRAAHQGTQRGDRRRRPPGAPEVRDQRQSRSDRHLLSQTRR